MTHSVRLHEHVSLIGSGELALTNYLDCHVYLLHDGDEYALVDAGSGVQSERLIENLKHTVSDLSRLRYLLLTHCHGDHAGGVDAIQKICRVEVVSSEWEVQMLADGSDDDLGLTQARFAGTYPPDYRLTHAKADGT